MIHTPRFAPLLLTGLLAAGCAKNQTSMAPPPPPDDANARAQLAHDVRQRVQELQSRAAEYADNAQRLHTTDDRDYRRLVAEQFALLAQIIPMLTGPDMTGELQQQLRIIESTRSNLSTGSTELAVEPTVGTGLRAAHRALAAIQRQSFADTPEVSKAVEAMANQVNLLDTVTGAQHRWVSAQAFSNSAQAITAMGNTMSQRLGNQINRPAATPAPPPAKSDEKGPTAS